LSALEENLEAEEPPESFSPLKRERALAKLRSALAIAPDEKFLQMLWCVHALATGREDRAARGLSFPREAIGGGPGSEYAIHAWELETLVNQLLLTSKRPGQRFYPCDTHSTASEFINYLRRLENTEFGLTHDRVDIFNELHRIGQRQFPWQRPTPNLPDFYRPLYLYGQGAGADYFAEQHGLTVADFAKIGFALFGHFMRQPLIEGLPDYSVLGISEQTLVSALRLMTIDRPRAGPELLKLVEKSGSKRWPTAYQPSLLRRFPLIEYGNIRRWAPLPELVLQRVTFGLYYDLLRPGESFRNEIAGRFEQYCTEYLAAQMPAFEVGREYRYPVPGRRGGQDSPDILVGYRGELALIIECKATKLTLAAQYSDDPAIDAQERYAEIGKGVFQTWRFVSHCRRGLTQHTVSSSTRGIVLTLDTWMVMSRPLQDHVMAAAHLLADADPNILPEDRRSVVFAAVQDFEAVVSQTTEDTFLTTLASATEERFLGWLLPNVRRDIEGVSEIRKPYPFDPGEILPWWHLFRERAGR
jgi:hypothetical protein